MYNPTLVTDRHSIRSQATEDGSNNRSITSLDVSVYTEPCAATLRFVARDPSVLVIGIAVNQPSHTTYPGPLAATPAQHRSSYRCFAISVASRRNASGAQTFISKGIAKEETPAGRHG